MSGNALLSRVLKLSTKTVQFASASTGVGVAGTDITLFNITGRCLVTHFAVGCSQSLASSGSSIVSVGPPNNDQEFLANTDPTDIDSGGWWDSATPQAQAGNAVTDKVIGPASTTNANTLILNLEGTPTTDDITTGRLHFFLYWLPLSGDGNIAAEP